ncbi:hypothetical protein SAMN05428985_11134 [Nocardioides sp. YR527]|nr:hypothetical protein SAMN05428985_11134 [Nocardioides sp. YR527]
MTYGGVPFDKLRNHLPHNVGTPPIQTEDNLFKER